MKIFSPIVDHLKLQIRLNLKTRNVELKVTLPGLALVTVYTSAPRSVFCAQFVLWSVCVFLILTILACFVNGVYISVDLVPT